MLFDTCPACLGPLKPERWLSQKAISSYACTYADCPIEYFIRVNHLGEILSFSATVGNFDIVIRSPDFQLANIYDAHSMNWAGGSLLTVPKEKINFEQYEDLEEKIKLWITFS